MTRTLCTILFLFLACTVAPGQSPKYTLSEPTGLAEAGWNKVVCMNNGNTLLFHLENDKGITVTAYDSNHHEIARQRHLCRQLDIHILKLATFKGLYEVNGEAVLFMEQERLSRLRLIRLRFNAQTASLVEETVLSENKSLNQHTTNTVIKNREDPGYAVLYAVDVPQFHRCNIHVTCYDTKHNPLKDVILTPERKEQDYMVVLGAESQPNGICVTLMLTKQEMNATTHTDYLGNTNSLYGHLLDIYYIPKDSTTSRHRLVDVSSDVYPYFSTYTHNPFAGSLNMLVFCYYSYSYKFGTDTKLGAAMGNLFLRLDEQNMALTHNWITHKEANKYLRERTDTGRKYLGIPVKMFTNENGLTTMISTSLNRDFVQGHLQNNYYNYLENICITQVDDDGKEIRGLLLPFHQCVKTYFGTFTPDLFCKNAQALPMQRDQPRQAYLRQFMSFNPYFHNKELYIIYNDYSKNNSNTLAEPGDTVFDFTAADAFYYKMDRKKEISKVSLFGDTETGGHKTCFIESADFDPKRGIYAALVQNRYGNNTTLNMAWRKLD